MSSLRKFIFLATLFFSSFVVADTLDFYLSWGHKIKDSTHAVNREYNKEINRFLNRINSKRKNYSCGRVLRKFRSHMGGLLDSKKLGNTIISRAKDIHHFPGSFIKQVRSELNSEGLYYGLISFEKLKKVLNINGIYMGADKFAHFFEIGYWYYKRYNKNLKNFKKHYSLEKAKRMALLSLPHFGLKLENGWTGKKGGMLSYGDVEANYQGFTFYHSLCLGNNPRLYRENKKWKFRGYLNFANFVNPYFDDSYSGGEYAQKRWPSTKVKFKSLCISKFTPSIRRFLKAQRAYYSQFKDSFSARIVKNEILKGKQPKPDIHSLEKVCSFI